MKIEIESYRVRHGAVKYDLTLNEEDVFEGLELVDMLLLMFDYMADAED